MIYNLKQDMTKAYGIFLTVAVLLYCGNTINWQGTGNMTSDNMTIIQNYINTNFKRSWAKGTVINYGNTQLVDFTKGLSDELNSQWAQAWNVVLFYFTSQGSNGDTIVYGYAFRDHWLWMNGIKMDDNFYVSLVIWKDYNCEKWSTFNTNSYDQNHHLQNSFPDNAASVRSALQGLYTQLDSRDIWSSAKKCVDALQSSAGVKTALGSSDLAFSIIIGQDHYGQFFGRFCVKSYLANLQGIGNFPGVWGVTLVLQMR